MSVNSHPDPNRKGIAIGLTPGVTTRAAEKAFYYVEARTQRARHLRRQCCRAAACSIYYVNELVPQGEGPVILRDKNLLTTGLADAFFSIGDVVTLPGTGITLTVLAGTGGGDFDIQVDYTAPVTDYNVFITRGDTIDGDFVPWMSPDIWVDSPKNGFNLGGGPPPNDQIENPVQKVVNRIYARIHNAGPADAFDFDVRFRISEPYHTVGGEADFDKFVGIKHIDVLNAGTTTNVFVEWTPETDDEPHACVMVDIINLVGTDTNPNDNSAQENLHIVASVTSSPFHPVTYSYNLTNPYDRAALFYFRAQGAPKGWTVDLNPRKIQLNPGERMVGSATVTPPPDGKVLHERADSDHELDRARRYVDPGGRRRRAGRLAAAGRDHARSRCRSVLGQGFRDPAASSEGARRKARSGKSAETVRAYHRERVHDSAAAQSDDHHQVRRSVGQRHLPHGEDRCERVLRGHAGERHRRHVAGDRRVSRQQVRRPGDERAR